MTVNAVTSTSPRHPRKKIKNGLFADSHRINHLRWYSPYLTWNLPTVRYAGEPSCPIRYEESESESFLDLSGRSWLFPGLGPSDQRRGENDSLCAVAGCVVCIRWSLYAITSNRQRLHQRPRKASIVSLVHNLEISVGTTSCKNHRHQQQQPSDS